MLPMVFVVPNLVSTSCYLGIGRRTRPAAVGVPVLPLGVACRQLRDADLILKGR